MSTTVAKGMSREPNSMVDRKRLLTGLAAARSRTCVLIQGPAGSGKTTLAFQWRVRVISYGYDFAPMAIDASDGC